ncbi:hypothetical protein Tco_1363469, partial [Tanacetum coccineum]
WKPTRHTFTIVGNSCPLTRITSTKVEPLKETTLKLVSTTNPEIKIYRRKTKVAKSVDLSNEPSILGSRPYNITQPKKHWGSTISKSPYFSLVNFVPNVLRYLDSGCSKHMTGYRSQLINFVHKYLDTVRFGNDQIEKIIGYGDYQMRNVTISRVYYMEGLGHNLFFVGNFMTPISRTRAKSSFSNTVCPTNKEGSIHVQPMFDEYFTPSPSIVSLVPTADAPRPVGLTSTPSSTIIDQDAPSLNNDPFFGVLNPELNFKESSSKDLIPANGQLIITT